MYKYNNENTYIQNTTIFEYGTKGSCGIDISTDKSLKNMTTHNTNKEKIFPNFNFIDTAKAFPELSEFQVIRHFTTISQNNFCIDTNIYPLGSCTMKYNPKINDALASLPGFANIHPHKPVKNVQGALHIMYELEQMLLKITGMSAATLQPSAGSQGEFAGILIMKKYHEQNGKNRKYIIIPETAHGTNPASVSLGGLKTREVKSDNRGRVDFEDLKSKLDDEVAGMMLTQPNTLGLFEDQIEAISEEVHKVGALMYMDGANMNAVVGLCKPAEMGFDIIHINLHKTFSTPHGGGGPGAGPIAVVEKLAPFLPIPKLIKDDNGKYNWISDLPDSIGRLHSFFGNFGIGKKGANFSTTAIGPAPGPPPP
jgi:glycine dehydrogenase subunit 2